MAALSEKLVHHVNLLLKPSSWLQFINEMGRQIRRHSLIAIASIISFVSGFVLKSVFNLPFELKIWPYLELALFVIVPIAFLWSQVMLFFYFILFRRPKHPIREFALYYADVFLSPSRYAKAIPMFIIMTIGFIGYTEMKPLIPLINDFAWDQTFADWDRVLHFGVDPWRLLIPVFGSGFATFLLNFCYNFWFIIMFVFWLAAIWTKEDNGWERPFLLSFQLTWFIGGFILATFFSSMGPAFYDLIDPASNPFADQMAILNNHDENYSIWALTAQNTLREAFLNPAEAGIAGISAMPSMHNATTTLFALAAFRINKFFGYLMTAYLIVIVIGSVHLAWHYAIDAYAGILLAYLIWRLSIWLTEKQDHFIQRSST